jgi:hypothetical protein
MPFPQTANAGPVDVVRGRPVRTTSRVISLLGREHRAVAPAQNDDVSARAHEIPRAAVEGRLPYGLNTSSYSELPILWEEQLHLAS